MFPRPRGRKRKGCEWNESTGRWEDEHGNSTALKSYIKKERIIRTVIVPPPTQHFFKESNVNGLCYEKAHYKEVTTIDENKKAEEMKQQTEAEYDFLIPYNTAMRNYLHNTSIPTYWLDKNNNFYKCPDNPYENIIDDTRVAERLFTWRTKTIEKKIRHRDDPDALAEGEWEYRRVEVWYKDFN